MEDNIKGFKLMNGSEIIAKLLNKSQTGYDLDDAIFWDIVQVAQDKWDVQFVPLSTGMKLPENQNHPAVKLTLPDNAVLFVYDVRDEIIDRYKQLISPILLLNNKIR